MSWHAHVVSTTSLDPFNHKVFCDAEAANNDPQSCQPACEVDGKQEAFQLLTFSSDYLR